MTLESDLNAAIEAGDAAACAKLVRGKTEVERAGAAAAMHKAFERAHKGYFGMMRAGETRHENAHERLEAAQVAVLGVTNSPLELKKYAWRSVPPDELAIAVLTDRRPAWTERWAEMVLEIAPLKWPLVRALVRAGVCPKPTSDGYTLGMIVWAAARFDSGERHALHMLESDPALIDEGDVWRVFEVEGTREASLTGSERGWTPALLELAKKGRMDRGRMIDATLDALARDFAQHKAGFYTRFHGALEVTGDERAARVGRYLALLASRIGPTVSLAIEVLEGLAEHPRFDHEGFVEAAPRALSTTSKAAVKSTIAMLEAIARAKPELRDRAVRAVTGALEQENAELQSAALALIEAHGSRDDNELVEAVRERAAGVSASLKKRLDAWAGAKGAAKKAPSEPAAPVEKSAAAPWLRELAGVSEGERAAKKGSLLPAVSLLGERMAPRLDPSAKLRAVETVDELFEAVSRALEDREDPMLEELMLDGAARFGSPLSALPTERVKPLRKRARSVANRRWAEDASHFVAQWLEGERYDDAEKKRHGKVEHARPESVFVRRRAYVLDGLIAGKKPVLLATPTHRGGWIDPRVLVARAAKLDAKAAPQLDDAVLALLRLAPEHRERALAGAGEVPGDFGAALRYALGGERKGHPGPDALWIAAARARLPYRDDAALAKALGETGPDGARAARVSYDWKARRGGGWRSFEFERATEPAKPKSVAREHVTVLMYGAEYGSSEVGPVRALASVYPLARTGFFAMGAHALQSNLDWWGAEWGNHAFIDPLLDPDVALDAPALATLALGLAAKESREHGLAVDALVACVSDGRLVGRELGEAMATLWHPAQGEDGVKGSRPTGSRWAKTLALAAKSSELHSEAVRTVIETLIERFDPAANPPDLHALLALWVELCAEAETGVLSKPARAKLEALEGGGKTAANKKALLARPQTPSVLVPKCVELALRARHARADRWAAWLAASE